MAMMVTGRVLLMCALCVLWCLTVFGDARDNRCVEGDGNVLTRTHNGGNNGLRLKADCGLISTRMGLIKAVAAGEREEELESVDAPLDSVGGTSPGSLLAVTEGNAAPGAGGVEGAAGAATPSLPVSGPGVSGTGDEGGQLPVAGQEGNEKNNLDPGSKEPKESQDQNTDQLSSPSGSTSTRSDEKLSSTGTDDLTPLSKDTETELGADRQDNRESNEAIEEEDGEKDKGKKQEKNILQPETQEVQNNGGGTPPPSLPALPLPLPPSGVPAPSSTAGEGSPPTEPKNSQNSKKIKNEATPSGPTMESKATQPPSGDATQGQHSHDTDTEDSTKNATTGSPAEPTSSSTSTSGSGDHFQNKADKNDAQSSEGQHDSLETGNTNVVPTLSETAPQTAKTTNTAQTNDTATPGDSDGSTAVSHTTSPLLLLLVACAAAAAVVAA
ncbi:Mucin-associated surface protein (MASP) [Trypanosoma cruzi]|uniref:Mucin-associated surface protein (MASP), putative n=2 Tax=Trypanosoma cruzi TaxID=5693 RepID=Q4E229_TRYCC|nr:mucin-associated surface protein (MASP), putative [Trypanosoma cruzi]EAN98839.1 mucin-associated surface protein (MASP), putative [Trypanosoma cruzi]PWV19822.1 Mucin-associated surface protein (MASP) [Trypanosoma cruzi]RNC52828.1 mucin-associated surface protein (MASP) [Trypanosoma cruzi]|eukprot:XP_820690.1 mucin-associated surface protein (MASP) [Trypanosoma cruzi strain CL Brener]